MYQTHIENQTMQFLHIYTSFKVLFPRHILEIIHLELVQKAREKPARQDSTEHIEEGAIKRYKIERTVLLRVCLIETIILNRLTHTGVLLVY